MSIVILRIPSLFGEDLVLASSGLRSNQVIITRLKSKSYSELKKGFINVLNSAIRSNSGKFYVGGSFPVLDWAYVVKSESESLEAFFPESRVLEISREELNVTDEQFLQLLPLQ